MRILLVADSCNPSMASTPYFGYQICKAVARQVEQAVVATQVRNHGAVDAETMGVEKVAFIDTEYIARPLFKLSRWLRGGPNKALTLNVALNYASYLAFERGVWKRFGDEIRRGAFDVVHRVTPLSPTLPSPLASWSPAPFVLGPVNGGLKWPRAFFGELRREREWMRSLRGAHTLMPYYRSTYRDAAAILAGFDHTIADLPASARPRTFDCPDVGYDDAASPTPPERPPGERMTVLFVGRLVPYKCPDVVVDAFAASPALRKHRLVMVGDGPDRERLEASVDAQGLRDCVEFTGWLPHDETAKHMAEADVFAFPSIRELGAGVVIEAMGQAMACVVVDYGGPGRYVDADRGVKVPLTTKPEVTEAFRGALEELAADPERRARLGHAAQAYVKARHSWEAKARHIADVYEWVLGHRDEKPDFHAPGL